MVKVKHIGPLPLRCRNQSFPDSPMAVSAEEDVGRAPDGGLQDLDTFAPSPAVRCRYRENLDAMLAQADTGFLMAGPHGNH
jgi:hypothetical protein